MTFDLRLPIGLMFSVFGAMLTVFGLMSSKTIYERSLGINVNLWWGIVLLLFGVLMLLFAMRKNTGNPGSTAAR
jgi:protein-S-isoprenylcysteine O-methyltransferase Ste14